VAISISVYRTTRSIPRFALLVLAPSVAAVGGVILVFVRPLLQGFNEGRDWAYSPAHAGLAAVNMLGWPVALLAALGFWLMFEARAGHRWYWASWVGVWAATVVILPLVMVYHPWYSFSLVLGPLVSAAYGIDAIYARLRPASPGAGVVWIIVALSLNLPGLASHFVDGSRGDLRSAVAYVRAHGQAGDRIFMPGAAAVRYYAPDLAPNLSASTSTRQVEAIEPLVAEGGRLWVVIESGRGGLPDRTEQWLFANGSHQLHLSPRRFDYREHRLDLFLIDRPPVAAPDPAPSAGPGA
jgi:hypothetical protein